MLECRSRQKFPERNAACNTVRYFDSDTRFSRNGRDNPDARCPHGQGDVVTQVNDALDLNSTCRLKLVAGNRGALLDLDNFRIDTEVGKRLFEDMGLLLNLISSFGFRMRINVREERVAG